LKISTSRAFKPGWEKETTLNMKKKKIKIRLPINLKNKFTDYELSDSIRVAVQYFLDEPPKVPKKKYPERVETRFTIDPDLLERIRKYSQQKKLSVSAIIFQALELYNPSNQ
jgi:hypothetical protein